MFDMSKLKPVSLGRVAENKEVNTKFAKIYPIELLPHVEGNLHVETEEITTKGIDASEKLYSVTVKQQHFLEMEWIGETNRSSAPDLQIGEQVMIYQQGDSDTFYWSSLGRDDDLRRLETVIYSYNANPDPATEDTTVENTYVLTISSHDKHITLTTSVANEEFTTYQLKYDLAEGNVKLEDGEGNWTIMDSKNTNIELHNKDESFVRLNKKDITISSIDNILMETETFVLNCKHATINCDDYHLNASKTIDIMTPTMTVNATDYTQNGTTATYNVTNWKHLGQTFDVACGAASIMASTIKFGGGAVTMSGGTVDIQGGAVKVMGGSVTIATGALTLLTGAVAFTTGDFTIQAAPRPPFPPYDGPGSDLEPMPPPGTIPSAKSSPKAGPNYELQKIWPNIPYDADDEEDPYHPVHYVGGDVDTNCTGHYYITATKDMIHKAAKMKSFSEDIMLLHSVKNMDLKSDTDINLTTKADINIKAGFDSDDNPTEGKVNITSGTNIDMKAEIDVNIESVENVNITSGINIDMKAEVDVNIESVENVNITSGKAVTVTAETDINFTSTLITNFVSGTDITMTAAGNVDFVAAGDMGFTAEDMFVNSKNYTALLTGAYKLTAVSSHVTSVTNKTTATGSVTVDSPVVTINTATYNLNATDYRYIGDRYNVNAAISYVLESDTVTITASTKMTINSLNYNANVTGVMAINAKSYVHTGDTFDVQVPIVNYNCSTSFTLGVKTLAINTEGDITMDAESITQTSTGTTINCVTYDINATGTMGINANVYNHTSNSMTVNAPVINFIGKVTITGDFEQNGGGVLLDSDVIIGTAVTNDSAKTVTSSTGSLMVMGKTVTVDDVIFYTPLHGETVSDNPSSWGTKGEAGANTWPPELPGD